ncbi:hypothetical protein HDV05_006511 [Chytridiales sp. JEL 0842]|nr:hypothetical protein HDV05_006511 [Chytridiales sp. JEL 0842]
MEPESCDSANLFQRFRQAAEDALHYKYANVVVCQLDELNLQKVVPEGVTELYFNSFFDRRWICPKPYTDRVKEEKRQKEAERKRQQAQQEKEGGGGGTKCSHSSGLLSTPQSFRVFIDVLFDVPSIARRKKGAKIGLPGPTKSVGYAIRPATLRKMTVQRVAQHKELAPEDEKHRILITSEEFSTSMCICGCLSRPGASKKFKCSNRECKWNFTNGLCRPCLHVGAEPIGTDRPELADNEV